MNIILFSLIMLSSMFVLVLGFWWDSTAPFKVHISTIAAVLAMFLSATLAMTLYPKLKRRFQSEQSPIAFDDAAWGQDLSSKLSTPAAVIDGYNIKFANNAFLKELGMNGMRDMITDLPLTNLIHPSSHQQMTDFLGRQHNKRSNETMMLRMLYVDGTTIPAQISLSPLNSVQQDGQFLLQFTTTTSSEPTSNKLDIDHTYRYLIDRLEQIVFQINVDQKIIFLNPAWEHVLDYTSEESMQQTLFQFIHPEDLPLAEARINALTEGKRHHSQFELRLIAKNGRSQWFEMRATTTSHLKSERTSVLGTLTDISRIKQTSAELKASARIANDMIMSNLPCMLYRCKNDRNWTFDFVSEGCFELTEYPPYEITNSIHFNCYRLIHPDDQARVWEYVQQQLSEQKNFQIIYRIQTQSNKVKWVLERGKGVFSGTDELLTIEGIIIDISHCNYHAMMEGLEQLISEQ
ncbi:MAG: histidine kinase [Methylophaga sp.]|uniref:PAS domain-containing protein n=1 Tax=Methylophaga sp. UBA678 TaxID=1946901 RepID=UPI000C48193A|nr:PAS domain-containing protein [Methylophaga sp. UBA678]MAX52458.1 histidine kinase [Methylophaga sp.]|tara:strand:+ start:116677 stop:118062 length:1386 start_codon:yes stop_codon:yes gene_type:complete